MHLLNLDLLQIVLECLLTVQIHDIVACAHDSCVEFPVVGLFDLLFDSFLVLGLLLEETTCL